jgi:hypothetical protein
MRSGIDIGVVVLKFVRFENIKVIGFTGGIVKLVIYKHFVLFNNLTAN